MATTSILRRLAGKVAVITGGASGIGECSARHFVRHGAKVIIADIQDELGRAVCDEIGDDAVSYVHCDVRREADVENAVNAAVSKHGKLDIMFSNAGVSGKGGQLSILDSNYDNFKNVFDANVFGAFMCAKHAARVMIPARKGSVIFTSSVASVTHGHVPHEYSASKHAVVGLAKNLGVELGRYGVRVNCVSPFGVATPMLRGYMGIDEKERVEEFWCGIANLKEAKLEAKDVAEAVLYLASDESKYVSGLNLVIDGGFSTTNVALSQSLNN